MRDALTAAALQGARAVGYVGAGTWEFLAQTGTTSSFSRSTPASRSSTRCPRRSPVSTSSGSRFCGRGRGPGPGPGRLGFNGHAIEARLYAEDPTADWRPSVGRIHRFRVPKSALVRVDAGVSDGSVVSPWYDSMLAKVIAYAPTRVEAARTLASSLARAGAPRDHDEPQSAGRHTHRSRVRRRRDRH